MTNSERALWHTLRGRTFKGLKFNRQKPLYFYIADFYCAELQLVIEIDGAIHKQQLEYDEERTSELSQFGVTVVRYSNDQILHNLKFVLSDLSQHVECLRNGNPPPVRRSRTSYPRPLPLQEGSSY